LKKGFHDYVKNENPDIFCIQETKVSASEVKENFLPGYYCHFNGAQKKKDILELEFSLKLNQYLGKMELELLITMKKDEL